MSLVDSGDASTHCPVLFSRSTDFSSPLQGIASFGVRVYVSYALRAGFAYVAGGSVTTVIISLLSKLAGIDRTRWLLLPLPAVNGQGFSETFR